MSRSRTRSTLLGALLAGAAFASGAAGADEFEQHGVHEHGHVQVNVALDGENLAVEFEAPAINVVGFERAPRSDAERKAVADTSAKLKTGRGLVGVPASAGCRLQANQVDEPKFGGGEHADYSVKLAFRCANPAALRWLELWMLRDLREVAEAEVNVVTARVQRQLKVQPSSPRVSLE